MKHNYTWNHIMVLFIFFMGFTPNLEAQVTQPTPQDLPFTQNFSTLDATSTTYSAGFQGWKTATAPSGSSLPGGTTAYLTTGVLLADQQLVSSSSASNSSGSTHNYNGKIGILNTGSNDFAIGLAINTAGKSGIEMQYNAMTIRNPYSVPPSTTNTRINEMSLQYRVGTIADFITVPNTAYQNNTTTQIASGVTTPQNQQLIKVLLPSECNNQPIVQIRWISRQVSGGGARPSFAIDDISIQNDNTPPLYAAGLPKINTILSTGFNFVTKINEPGKTFYVVLPAGSTAPSIAQIKTGNDATNTAAIKSGLLTIIDPEVEYTQSLTGLSIGTSYDLYAISEDGSGNTQASSTVLNVTTASVAVPSITPTVSNLNFGFVEQNTTSTPLQYDIQAENLTNDITVTATGNFVISKTETGTYVNSLNYGVNEFTNAALAKVFVKFTPTAIGTVTGTITHQTTGGSNKTVALTGKGINPYFQDFNDPNVLTNSGWTEYSVAGNNLKWTSTNTRFNSSPAAVQMNGYAENGASKDWLISPVLRLNAFDKFPLLSFYARKFFSGTPLKLMVSTNYDGKSNPETATWTAIEGDFPTTTGTFKQSQFINLEAYKTNTTYVAWVYESATSGGTDSAEWTIDDVRIANETTFIASNPNLNFGEISPNTTSTSQSFIFMAGGFGNITINAPANYELSTDNSVFTTSLVVTAVDAVIGKLVYARFVPTSKELSISGPLKITGTGLNQEIGSFKGSSLPKTETFDIVTYNLEFFGTDVKDTSGTEFGPTNDVLQIDNVAKVINTMNADVYAVQEVSDDAALETLIQKISVNGKTFAKSVSPVWSRSFQAPDPNFPPQKLVVLYNTQTTTVKKSRVMFSKLYDEVRAGTKTLPNYPSTGDSFYSSGRLPYMVEIETNINGVKKDLTIINLHARANSGSDIARYNMRKYDVELLKDSLDVNYPNANIILLGDYNDDVDQSVIAGNPSSYQKLVEDTARYNTLTLDISKAGAFSYLSSGGFLDHILVSNELTDEYVTNSTVVYDPRNDVPNYVTTTSDHGPVIARFELKADPVLSVNDVLPTNKTIVKMYPNPVSDILNVSLDSFENEKVKLQFYDVLGRAIGMPIQLSPRSNRDNSSIDVSQLPTGIYIYSLSVGNKIIQTDKIIKK
ncbi:endonuclease [Flavobacterium sp. SOK18b]|uniref:T9SS-dependent choice-of-anchor J family protein n=1 Tax=Flavobacterium sp. SOK18b TaxID=797900 RepID=UPI0015F9B8EE|nr:choice-of-anchor J domain-containing protein [Flavobacterium sp. SOK18b]MBB1192126.1 endonuclease [Flavobacterium sp. SOK18b]